MEHDCQGHAIHGWLAQRHHGKAVEECMKCGNWRAPFYGIADWQPATTLREFLRSGEITEEDIAMSRPPEPGR